MIINSMKLIYVLIIFIILAIIGLYIWNVILQTKRIPLYREDDVRLYPVVEYPIDEYPYYYGWWWPWYGGSYNIVGSRYGNYPYPLPYYGHGGGGGGSGGHHGGRPGGHHGGGGGGSMPSGGGHGGGGGGMMSGGGGGGHGGSMPAGGGGGSGGGMHH
jgi:hypothetical protein